jgi:hypothetical protein
VGGTTPELVGADRLQSGQIVVMDNLSARKHPQAQEKIEQYGA